MKKTFAELEYEYKTTGVLEFIRKNRDEDFVREILYQVDEKDITEMMDSDEQSDYIRI